MWLNNVTGFSAPQRLKWVKHRTETHRCPLSLIPLRNHTHPTGTSAHENARRYGNAGKRDTKVLTQA
jgi:hypothetical protein